MEPEKLESLTELIDMWAKLAPHEIEKSGYNYLIDGGNYIPIYELEQDGNPLSFWRLLLRSYIENQLKNRHWSYSVRWDAEAEFYFASTELGALEFYDECPLRALLRLYLLILGLGK